MQSFFISFLFVSISFSGYFEDPYLHYLHPTPTPADILSMFWISPSVGFLTSDCGEILRTTDGGTTFTFGNKGPGLYYDVSINDIFFLDNDRGWAASDGGKLFKTEDGGITWQSMGLGLSSDLYGVQFIDDQCGTIVAENNKILRTVNGGASWTTQSVTGGDDWYDVHFNDISEGWVAGSSGIAYTGTAGAFWEFQCYGSFRAMDFTSQSNGWAVGDNGTVVHSSDGGLSWDQVSIPGNCSVLTDVDFFSENEGWISGDGYASYSSRPVVFHTDDAGVSWSIDTLQTPYSCPDYRNGWAVSAVGDGFCYYGGENGLFHVTQDGGSTWNMITESVSHKHIRDVYFTDALSGWAISANRVIRTQDGGESWEDVTPVTVDLSSASTLHFNPDGQHGWVGGGNGFLMRTDDGGASWTTLSTGQSEDIIDVAFNSSGYGIYTLWGGQARQSSDWGTTWEDAPGVTGRLWDIEFINENSGYVGGEGLVYRFDDQGDSWCNLNFPVSNYVIFDVFALDNDVVYVTGTAPYSAKGSYLYSENGGGSWETVYTSINANFDAVFFLNPSTGVLVYETYLAAVTESGGDLWTQHELNGPICEYSWMAKAFFLDSDHAWLPSPGVMEISFISTGNSEDTYRQIGDALPDFNISPCPVQGEIPMAVFSVPEPGRYTLSVFDITGRVVLRHCYDNLPAGDHSIPMDTADLPGSMYLCTLSRNGHTRTARMVLIRR